MNERFLTRAGWALMVGSLLVGWAGNASAQISAADLADNISTRKSWDDMNAPFKPFKVMGNIYYVGMAGVSAFLIATPDGDILMDTGFEESVPRIQESIEKLGFKFSDIKIILNNHAHLDHCGGDAMVKSLTGAQIMMSAEDAKVLESGGAADYTPFSLEMKSFPAAHADRLLKDGDEVKLGGTVLTCHLTPGHTKGCTTWTMNVADEGKTYRVVFYGSTSLLSGVNLPNNPKYPNIVADYQASFKKLKEMPCDVFLAPHALFFDLAAKAERLERGEKPNPFIDPQGLQKAVGMTEKHFNEVLAEQRKEVR